MASILYVEDEKNIARFVELELTHEDHQVTICHDGREGLETALTKNFDLILLDIMLPSLNGMEILRRIKKEKDTPVIMLTAKDDVSDKVYGLDSGAEDYLTKPFAIEELLARIRRLLRTKEDKAVLSINGLTVNLSGYEVKFNGQLLSLSKTEFDMLVYFLQNKGVVLSREKILDAIWGYDYYGDTNIVDVYVRYLRAKIDEPFGVKLFHTVRGVGYTLDER